MATTPYPFVANTVLTASQLNSTFNIPVSTKTASYTLVAADAGTRVVMNSATATTITVNTSLFAAGDNLQILNIGAGVCTVTAGTATVSTSGTLALVANAGGTLYFTSAGVSVFQATGVAAAAGGLVFISATAMAGASVSVNNCFTSTYDNYRLIFAPSAVTSDAVIAFRLRLSGTDSSTSYRSQRIFATGTSITTLANPSGTSDMFFGYVKSAAPTNTGVSVDIFAPALARATVANSISGGLESTDNYALQFYSTHTPATAYDGFTLTTAATTTGTIYLYGYAKA